MQHFDKGLKLYAFARDKARKLGMPTKAVKMEELISMIQGNEGNTPCFRKQKLCSEISCCWQVSCGARIISD